MKEALWVFLQELGKTDLGEVKFEGLENSLSELKYEDLDFLIEQSKIVSYYSDDFEETFTTGLPKLGVNTSFGFNYNVDKTILQIIGFMGIYDNVLNNKGDLPVMTSIMDYVFIDRTDEEVCKRFESVLGILLDCVKRGVGSSHITVSVVNDELVDMFNTNPVLSSFITALMHEVSYMRDLVDDVYYDYLGSDYVTERFKVYFTTRDLEVYLKNLESVENAFSVISDEAFYYVIDGLIKMVKQANNWLLSSGSISELSYSTPNYDFKYVFDESLDFYENLDYLIEEYCYRLI